MHLNKGYKYLLYIVHNSDIIIYKKERDMPQIRPITDLRNTTEISEICHTKNEPLFITKNGYGDLVVMSIETYEEMLETSQIDKAISEAEREFTEEGVLIDAREVFRSLRRKAVSIPNFTTAGLRIKEPEIV